MSNRSLKVVSLALCMLIWPALTLSVVAADELDQTIYAKTGSVSPTLASMDYCADQYILALADRDQIVGLSADATSVYSFFGELAVGIPTSRGAAEEILAIKPDMVVRQWQGNAEVDSLFERAGIRAVTILFASSPDAALGSLITFGDQIGRGEQARAFADKRRAVREKLAALPPSGLKALYVTPSGYTAGTGTNVDAIIKSAGLNTMADDFGLRGWYPLPMESIARAKPDVIITSFFELPAPASRWSLSQSPLINQLLADLPVIDLPASYLSCNGLFDIDAASYIRAEAQKLGLAAY